MNKLYSVIILAFALITGFCSELKSQTNDAGLWTEITIEKRFTQALSVEYEHSTRLNENISEVKSIINDIGLKYRLSNNSRIALFYRFNNQRQLNNQYLPVNRFYFDFSYRNRICKFRYNIRVRTQIQQKYSFFYDFEGDSRIAVRPKLTISYPIEKFEPYFSSEVYLPIFNNKYKPMDKIRLQVGIDYSINNRHSLGVGYMVQREYFTNNPLTDFVTQIGYKFRFAS